MISLGLLNNPEVFVYAIYMGATIFVVLSAITIIRIVLAISAARHDLRLSSRILNELDQQQALEILEKINGQDGNHPQTGTQGP